jgi:hypothetical protein
MLFCIFKNLLEFFVKIDLMSVKLCRRLRQMMAVYQLPIESPIRQFLPSLLFLRGKPLDDDIRAFVAFFLRYLSLV